MRNRFPFLRDAAAFAAALTITLEVDNGIISVAWVAVVDDDDNGPSLVSVWVRDVIDSVSDVASTSVCVVLDAVVDDEI